MTIRVTHGEAAVDHAYYWQPMSTCPIGAKVQLLNPGHVAVYGMWNGRDRWWLGWAPLPKIDRNSEAGR